MTAYLVIIDGQGETRDDYSVLVIHADSPQAAVDEAIAPASGYGRDDGTAYVVREDQAEVFDVSPRSFRVAVMRP